MPEKTDKYFGIIVGMFADAGITFADARVVDGRLSPEQARQTIEGADVVWLAGGDTLARCTLSRTAVCAAYDTSNPEQAKSRSFV